MKNLKLKLFTNCLFVLFANMAIAQQVVSNIAITGFYEGPFEDVISESRRTQKPIFVDFTATWCKPCIKMEQETFSDPIIAQKLNDEFIAYKVDVDDFDGLALAQKYKVGEYPTYLILDSKTNKIGTIKGFYYSEQFIIEINNVMKPKSTSEPVSKKKKKLFSR